MTQKVIVDMLRILIIDVTNSIEERDSNYESEILIGQNLLRT